MGSSGTVGIPDASDTGDTQFKSQISPFYIPIRCLLRHFESLNIQTFNLCTLPTWPTWRGGRLTKLEENILVFIQYYPHSTSAVAMSTVCYMPGYLTLFSPLLAFLDSFLR